MLALKARPQFQSLSSPFTCSSSTLYPLPSIHSTMVGGGFLIRTALWPSRSPSSSFHIFMPLASFLCLPRATIFRRFNHDNHHNHHHHEPEERAPSTAEEFKRVAEEKLRVVKKAYDGTEEAVNGGSNIESDQKKNEDHERNAGIRRRGDKDRDV